MVRSMRVAAALLVAGVSSWFAAPGSAVGQRPAAGGSAATEKAITLSTPGVVFVATSVAVKVRLTLQNAAKASGLSHVDQTYKLAPYAFGSGFVVNPNGVVVTASHVVEPDQQLLQNYAANNLILEGLNYNYPKSTSSEFEQYNLPSSYYNNLLHQCYKGIDCDFGIVPAVTVFQTIESAGSQKPEGSAARVVSSSGFSNTDVAVLQMSGSNMPTVPLAQSAGDLGSGDEIVAIGYPATSVENFTSGVTTPAKVFGRVSSIRTEGTSKVIEIDANVEQGESGGPVVNDSAQVIGLVSYGFGGASGPNYLRTVDDVRAGLKEAGLNAQRGPADAAFEKGMQYFWGHHYTAAIPELNRAVQLSPGFPTVQDFLSQAQAKKGTAADVPLDTGGGSGLVLWIIVGAAVVLVIVAIVAVTRRNKEPAVASAGVAPGGVAPMTGAMPTTPPISGPPSPAPPVMAPSPPAAAQPSTAPPAPKPPPPEVPPAPPTSQGTPPPTSAAEPPSEEPAPPAEPSPRSAGEEVHFCSNCGHQVQAGERFCPNCGHDLKT